MAEGSCDRSGAQGEEQREVAVEGMDPGGTRLALRPKETAPQPQDGTRCPRALLNALAVNLVPGGASVWREQRPWVRSSRVLSSRVLAGGVDRRQLYPQVRVLLRERP